jgi:hypothetical protein
VLRTENPEACAIGQPKPKLLAQTAGGGAVGAAGSEGIHGFQKPREDRRWRRWVLKISQLSTWLVFTPPPAPLLIRAPGLRGSGPGPENRQSRVLTGLRG